MPKPEPELERIRRLSAAERHLEKLVRDSDGTEGIFSSEGCTSLRVICEEWENHASRAIVLGTKRKVHDTCGEAVAVDVFSNAIKLTRQISTLTLLLVLIGNRRDDSISIAELKSLAAGILQDTIERNEALNTLCSSVAHLCNKD